MTKSGKKAESIHSSFEDYQVNFKMKNILYSALLLFGFVVLSNAQTEPDLNKYMFQVNDLTEEKFIVFTKELLNNSQFVFIGEQHGIKEVGEFTNQLFNLGQEFNYKALCIETDAVAARKISEAAKSGFTKHLKPLHNKAPFSIPFYENEDDAVLFENVMAKGGSIWGIDQTFMTQFRMNFDHLIENTSNKKLKEKLNKLKNAAHEAYKVTVETKDFTAPYLFKYDEKTHKELLQLATKKAEKEIVEQLWNTKTIYGYNFSKQFYLNNNERGKLMKENFMKYYRKAEKKEDTPKVIFKLGGYHASKGLTRTNIYDIANMGSELAASNSMKSIHYLVMGISGTAAIGNPFAPQPTAPFNSVKTFPKEVQELVKDISEKYAILDLNPLKELGYGDTFSDDFKKWIFGYDVLILVKDAEPLKMF